MQQPGICPAVAVSATRGRFQLPMPDLSNCYEELAAAFIRDR
jgi:hypothetical protein